MSHYHQIKNRYYKEAITINYQYFYQTGQFSWNNLFFKQPINRVYFRACSGDLLKTDGLIRAFLSSSNLMEPLASILNTPGAMELVYSATSTKVSLFFLSLFSLLPSPGAHRLRLHSQSWYQRNELGTFDWCSHRSEVRSFWQPQVWNPVCHQLS